ncbi:sugar kinase, partial [Rhizobium ruizarguesonis]
LAGTVPELVKLAGRPDANLAGIGISMPGVINHEQTACVLSYRFKWDNVPLASLVASRVHVAMLEAESEELLGNGIGVGVVLQPDRDM